MEGNNAFHDGFSFDSTRCRTVTCEGWDRLYDSVAPLKLGTLDNAKRCWLGRMDEVRLTCAVLSEEQLLGTTPPPSGTVIMIR